MAFASDKKYSLQVSGNSGKNSKTVKKLLDKCTPFDIRKFFEQVLKREPDKIKDFQIFLAGSRETPVTVTDYKHRFLKVLNRINLKEMLELWYREGEDYYDIDSVYGSLTVEDSLSETVAEFLEEGEKYEENNNYAEAMKIYQAMHEALDEKEQTLKGNFIDLQDAFDHVKQEVINHYLSVLAKSRKINLNPAASSLLAFLYQQAGKMEKFETICLKNLIANPELILDLVEYYKKSDRKTDIVGKSQEVLALLGRKEKDFFIDYKDLEIRLRNFLKEIYSHQTEYTNFIDNLERIFLLTGLLKDYKDLVKNYRQAKEKEAFWQKMGEYFEKKQSIKNIFKVFKFEDKKEKILTLVKNHHKTECFPEMIAFIQDQFSKECFFEYKKKIDTILEIVDVGKYREAAYHLSRMQLIGLDTEFANYVNFIKINYWRRRRLLEELNKHKLCGKI